MKSLAAMALTSMVFLLFSILVSNTSFATSLEKLEKCGVFGTRVTLTFAQKDILPGEYFLVNRINPRIKCKDNGWVFLADPDTKREIGDLLSSGTQVLLSTISPDKRDSQYKTQAGIFPSGQEIHPELRNHLASEKNTLLVTPSTDYYSVVHEKKHLIDLANLAPRVRDISFGLTDDQAQIMSGFLFEAGPHAHEITEILSSNKAQEVTLNPSGKVQTAKGTSFRRQLIGKLRNVFEHVYGQPFRRLLDQLKKDAPVTYFRVVETIGAEISIEQLDRLGIKDFFPEWPQNNIAVGLVTAEKAMKGNLSNKVSSGEERKQTHQRLMSLMTDYQGRQKEFLKLNEKQLTDLWKIIKSQMNWNPSRVSSLPEFLNARQRHAIMLEALARVKDRILAINPMSILPQVDPEPSSAPQSVQPSRLSQLSQPQINIQIEKAYFLTTKLAASSFPRARLHTSFFGFAPQKRGSRIFEVVLMEEPPEQLGTGPISFVGPKLMFEFNSNTNEVSEYKHEELNAKYVIFGNMNGDNNGQGFSPKLSDLIVAPISNQSDVRILFDVLSDKSAWRPEFKASADVVAGNTQNAPWFGWSLTNLRLDPTGLARYKAKSRRSEIVSLSKIEEDLLSNNPNAIGETVSITLPPLALLDEDGRVLAGALSIGDIEGVDSARSAQWALDPLSKLHVKLASKFMTPIEVLRDFDSGQNQFRSHDTNNKSSVVEQGDFLQELELSMAGSVGMKHGKFANVNFKHLLDFRINDSDIIIRLIFQNNLENLVGRPIFFLGTESSQSNYENAVEVWTNIDMPKTRSDSLLGPKSLRPAEHGTVLIHKLKINPKTLDIEELEAEIAIQPRTNTHPIVRALLKTDGETIKKANDPTKKGSGAGSCEQHLGLVR